MRSVYALDEFMNDVKHLDYDTLNALKDVMEDSFELLVDTFIQDSVTRLSKLHSLVNVANHEADAIRRAAHSFKGSCGNMGAHHMVDLCSSLEQKALNSHFDNLPADIKAIDDEFLVVKKLLLDYLG